MVLEMIQALRRKVAMYCDQLEQVFGYEKYSFTWLRNLKCLSLNYRNFSLIESNWEIFADLPANISQGFCVVALALLWKYCVRTAGWV